MARRSGIRASDADREGVVERLRQAAAEGRLAAHELEHRVTTALKAQTYGELDATVSDLPSTAKPTNRRSSTGWAVTTVRNHPVALVALIPLVVVVVAVMITIAVMAALVAVLAMLFGLHRRPPYRGGPPWLYGRHYRRVLTARRNSVGGFIPWL